MIALALSGIWKVLAAGLLFGAGLPTVFALGVRSLALAEGGEAEATPGTRPHPSARVLGIACLAVVLLAVALGIAFIVASGLGKELSFGHGYPTFADKE
ncbi:hypothetical protein H9L10_00705 [Phycicoccus endophyticus]|uniref:Uncharacterized protein n=1 Tax=Phycicoccus endophyticus TaxID=1690220 RepID=A0A7G9R248_9MICO|nr:hypothetical protein [Phycicoccus endophyticus]NHI19676.1 hypothetical protein [Phycicoccus endophyticus]QNN49673.1 hypothetical protein H9L10_00705 [Phycicoccus endophyticus]GGL33966.1 hypothetical protein GCM10012283_15520 [Phycicoccus endophyticus]